MTIPVTFFHNPMSRGQIARWALEEVGAPYETVILDYGEDMKRPEYLAINPMGKVPAIKHGDQVVTEAAAVCAYLADAFPDAGLAPRPAERGAYYRWMFFAAGPAEYATTLHSLGWTVPPDKVAMVGFGTYDDTVRTLDHAFAQGDYLCGDRFTMADVYAGSQADWGLQFGTLPKTAAIEAYVGRLRARDAYRRAKKIDNDLIEERQAAAS